MIIHYKTHLVAAAELLTRLRLGRKNTIRYLYYQMPRRFTIIALLWLTYALLLGHDLLPHHHHHDRAVAHQGGTDPHHHDSDQHDDGDDDEPDWWANHQHSPGVTGLGTATPTTHQAMPVMAIILHNRPLPFPKIVDEPGQTVGWPPA